MKLIFLISFLLIYQTNLRLTERNPYDYSSYSSVSTNENLSNENVASTSKDQSAVYITGTNSISDSNITKESGDSSNIENSEFFGVNAAILVQGGTLTMNGGQITTKAKGANALVATNSGVVTITGTDIISQGTASSRGLHSTYGGTIIAKKVSISSEGRSCANLATDRGEGTVTCEECTLSTKGAGSPLIYSTGVIIVKKTTGTASGAQAVVVEGKNTATVSDFSDFKCSASPNREEVDQCGVMLYQSMSGDAFQGTSNFECVNSNIEILQSSKYYSTAPMFFITNNNAKIQLTNCTFGFGSNKFVSLKGTNQWGKSGSNGGEVTLELNNQTIQGDLEVDGISTLTINMIQSTITGKINTANTAKKIDITLDKDSKITITGNSYCTSITNEDKTGANLVNGTYTWTIGSKNTNSAKGIYKLNWLLVSLSLIVSILF